MLVEDSTSGHDMHERELAEALLRDHVLASRALAALQLSQLPDAVRSRVHEAIQCGSGFAELRTRAETGQTELVLVPRDGSEPLWLTRMNGERADS
jgi:hypothetical protein